MIEVKNLSKKYGSKTALDDINFTVNDGEILGFLGPNGAGKSTTMNIITGYISSTEGTVTVDGDEIMENPIAVKRKIGYLPEQPPLYLDMTVKAYLSFMYDLKKVKLSKTQHIEEICKVVKIDDVYNRIIKHLSKGYKQRVGIAQALLGDPKLLILDEPTVGLDPNQIIEIRELIKSLSKKHTILLSSHIMQEVSAVCDKIIIINEGHLIAYDTPANIARMIDESKELIVTVKGDKNKIKSVISSINGIRDIKYRDRMDDGELGITIKMEEDADIREDLFNAMSDAGCPIIEMRLHTLTLEEIFLILTHDKNKIKEYTDKVSEENEVINEEVSE